ncbi:hypothetical protein Tco_0239855 [Tanacetum coccineum]
MSGPEYPPSPEYVPGLEEPEQAPLSLDYDPEEDPADGVDDADDESSDDDDDDDDDDEQKASKDDDEKEEEHPAPADSSAIPVDDLVPSAKDTEAFETDESAPTPVASPKQV